MTVGVHVLGTAQDGGIPHAGCRCVTCRAAREDPIHRRRVASVALVAEGGRVLLVDATPDFATQLETLTEDLGRARPPVFELLLTHAHIGHYLGLAWLGREGMNVQGVTLWCTPRMAVFLNANRPWSHLISRDQVVMRRLVPGTAIPFADAAVTPFLAPHRAEDTDTIGLDIQGASRRLIYLPDTDRFSDDLMERIAAADVALVDGTFYDEGELGGRDMSEVPHPAVKESVRLLSGVRGRVWFTHLNHTNALLLPNEDERPALPEGFGVLSEVQLFEV